MEIELNEKLCNRIKNLLQQKQLIDDQLNSVINTITEFNNIDNIIDIQLNLNENKLIYILNGEDIQAE